MESLFVISKQNEIKKISRGSQGNATLNYKCVDVKTVEFGTIRCN